MSAVDSAALAALWGGPAGALLPRAAYRFAVPSGEPWRERCPAGHPVRGWVGRTGCGACGGAGQRAGLLPAVLATALTCAVLGAATGARPELAVWLLLAPVGVLLAVVDVRVRRLPDPLTLPLAPAALALLGLAALLPGHAGHWPTALYGALALGAGYYALYRINPAGMGFGDVKLAVGMGAVLGWYGWSTVLFGAFAGFLLGALYGAALVLTRRAGRRSAIPFGPFLLSGALLGLLLGAHAA
ncbi:prepilin peptidase [Streptomyces broussonetiae]|uniref:Prepilin peptidase n=1 Tax=Streptomyces broussonetiae TaxID=2686304 RepID=A0A6I6NB69_9ACTN|nr:A24 family peptidase [Streptomyces broussonetiae]QHA06185.1 prepilin peptidase [Streptomyces broussonetiae]